MTCLTLHVLKLADDTKICGDVISAEGKLYDLKNVQQISTRNGLRSFSVGSSKTSHAGDSNQQHMYEMGDREHGG